MAAAAGNGAAPAAASGSALTGEQAQAAVRKDLSSDKLHEQYIHEQKRCISMAERVLEKSPAINYLLQRMDEKGCGLPRNFVRCAPLPSVPSLGTFVPTENRVVLNSLHTNNFKTVQRTLLHELVHAFDHCRVEMDYSSCRHLACTEIRAANLSTDCRWDAEWGRGILGLKGQQKACVKRRAKLSIQMTPACANEDVDYVIGSVFKRCYRDTEPFPSVPK